MTLARHKLKYSAGPMAEYKAMRKETKWQNVTCMKGCKMTDAKAYKDQLMSHVLM